MRLSKSSRPLQAAAGRPGGAIRRAVPGRGCQGRSAGDACAPAGAWRFSAVAFGRFASCARGRPHRARAIKVHEEASMAKSFTGRKRIRKSFGRIPEVAPMPNLIEVQKSSYDHFLQMGVAGRAARRRRPAGGLQVGLPDPRLLRARAARIRALRARAAEIRRRGMPAARHHLRRAAQGDAAPRRLGCRRGHRRALDPRHQGAGRLHGRHAAHDQERHLHHQRHRARHRLADAPLARRVLRPRQGQDAFARASISSPRASFPIAARGSISSSTPRTISMSASTGAASCR